jgi:hypothetical protein
VAADLPEVVLTLEFSGDFIPVTETQQESIFKILEEFSDKGEEGRRRGRLEARI